MNTSPLPCDVDGCTTSAVVVLRFRNMPGHVHVCSPHEAIDREWADVVDSHPLPCPWACENISQAIGRAMPTLLV